MDSDTADSSNSMSGIIQADNDIDFSKVFKGVHTLVKRHGYHPSLLPIQLFITHCSSTTETFKSILNNVIEVDGKLLEELEIESKSAKASKLYRKLSMTLHQCSMGLAELGRRRNFEEELGDRLRQDLQNEVKLEALVNIFANMSKSKDLDIASLPGKIESQRNVVSHWRSSIWTQLTKKSQMLTLRTVI
jgi:hypothetical protein